ncbi:MAG: helix-turn-helix domain-containing protein [Deltaproteobacteria bacterium]|jgi:ATP-dependent DNA helicase RecG|nr:helix-turn-helix domain-containing protein [Deltaproteobacteria bacterium]
MNVSKKKTLRHIKELIKTGEGYHLEFKKSLDKSFAEEVCAFANSSGGKILLGIADDGKSSGIKTDNVLLSRIQDHIKQIEPHLEIQISVLDNIVVVDIPEGKDKPYGCSKGFFLRIGPNSQKLTRNEIVSFFQKEGRIRFDELENGKAVFSRDFDVSAFNNFLQLASITPSIDKDFLLANLDCLSENGQMTNAGVLFFSKSTEFLLLQVTVTCVLYKGIERIYVLDRKDFSGNNIENAVMFVLRHTNLEYKIEKLRREEIPEIPEVALREAVVNAVCHRDYFEKGANVMIEIFDDRLEISSPGGLPSGLTRKSFGTKSVVRNPVIASLLHRAGYIEKIGTGIKRIENTVKEHGRGSVIFSFDSFFTVSFSRVKATEKISVKTAPEIEKATQETTQEIEKTTQETTQEMILRLIKTNPAITRKGLAEKTGLTPDGVKYHLNKLREQRVIRHVGATKKGYWEEL